MVNAPGSNAAKERSGLVLRLVSGNKQLLSALPIVPYSKTLLYSKTLHAAQSEEGSKYHDAFQVCRPGPSNALVEVSGNHGADAVSGVQLQQHAAVYAGVNQMGPLDAVLAGHHSRHHGVGQAKSLHIGSSLPEAWNHSSSHCLQRCSVCCLGLEF